MPLKSDPLPFLSPKSPDLPIHLPTQSRNHNRETIKNIPRSDIMRESVIYPDILEEGREEIALTAKLNSIPH
ncbi:hypothetical protein PN502_05495 [Microcystis aeruginosa CS-338/01]|uniref:hypothetical protein n=1 Tax=Microcystis aeruginosa TaxID=1126 RepID=UPI00232E2AFB|nr:hypothetical protein [Microcystis aeruginosa]MDB9506557.1 hypothetical protein [Microcystis aeruginosa CS-338/01]